LVGSRLSIGRCEIASGSRLLAKRCFIGIERCFVLSPFDLRDDLEEHDHDDPCPQCPTERIEQVADQSEELCGRRRLDQVSTDIRRQADRQAGPKDPVDGALSIRGLPYLRQVLAYPCEQLATFLLFETEQGLFASTRIVTERACCVLRSRSSRHI